jgi:hypothetical protein
MLRKRPIASVLASMLILLLASRSAVDAFGASAQPDPPSQYFPETKQNVNPPLIGYWQTHGGLAQQGYPISGELQLVSTDGKTYKTQFFERAVFEQHTEFAGTSNEVLLKLVGQTFYDRRFKDGPPKDQATNPDNTLTFKETGHSIGGKFRAYWEKHGGLAQQGYPMTDEFKMVSTDGKEYTTQIFQRAVFELHPEFAGSENEVLLRLLGVEELEEANRSPATATPDANTPTPNIASGTPSPTEVTTNLGGKVYKFPEYPWSPGLRINVTRADGTDLPFTNEPVDSRALFNNWISVIAVNAGITPEQVKAEFAEGRKVRNKNIVRNPNIIPKRNITPVMESGEWYDVDGSKSPYFDLSGTYDDPTGILRHMSGGSSTQWFVVGVTKDGQWVYAGGPTKFTPTDELTAGIVSQTFAQGLGLHARVHEANNTPYAPPDALNGPKGEYIGISGEKVAANEVPGLNVPEIYVYDPTMQRYTKSIFKFGP